MSLEARTLLSILRLSATQPDIRAIAQDARIPLDMMRKTLKKLAGEGYLRLDDGRVEISAEQQLGLVILAIQGGVDVERACKAIGWQAFEDLVMAVLDANEVTTRKHFRFQSHERRFEIDVLGLKEPVIFVIECKHWNQSWQRSATMKIVEKQIQRTKALVNAFQEHRVRLGVGGWSNARLLPVVLTLSMTPFKTYKNVPVVPIFYLQTFINDEMTAHFDEFTFYPLRGIVPSGA
jgi:Holliday junction resolvase-like predicted endonuclease